MKFARLMICFAMALFLMPSVLASLSITSSDSFTAVHNSVLHIPMNVSSTSDITNISMRATSITNLSETIAASITNSSKLSINAGQVKDYIIDYNIPQYQYAKSYSITLNVSGNENATGNALSTTKTISITVNETKGLSISATAVTVGAASGTTTATSFTITNTGSVNLTNIVLTQQSTLNDSDGSVIALSITSDKNLATLKPGEAATIYINASVPKAQQRKTYASNLLINSTEGIGAVVSYQINVKETYCELGNKGSDFTITIKDPNDGEDFYPNNEIPVMLRIKNNNDDDRDVVIEADLYDETDDQFVDVEYSTDATIDGDTSEDFEFTLKVPLDVSNTHDYKIFAKVYEDGNEDSQCREEYLSIDIKKDTHSVLFDKVEIPSTATCDGNFNVQAKLANAGKNDEEDIKLQVINSELGISEEKLMNIDSGESRTITVPIRIPNNAAEKDYTFTIRINYYLSNDEYRKDAQVVKTIKVQSNCLPVTENTVLSTEVLSDAVIGDQFGIKVTVFNTGTVAATYNVITSDYDAWARLDKVEPATITVEAGKSGASYVYLTPLANSAGSHTLAVKALFGSKSIVKTLSIPVTEKVTATSTYQKITSRLSNLSGFDLATVNIVLVVAIILIFIWIMRIRRAY